MKRYVGCWLFLLLLVQAGSTVAQTGNNESLIAVAKSGNTQEVKRLLAAGADCKATTLGTTPLHWASSKEVAELLIFCGADIKATGEQGFTVLHMAVYQNHEEVVALLISRGADIEAKDQDGFTPLHIAAYLSHRQMVELLIRNGANVNAQGLSGVTPLHKAMERLANPDVLPQPPDAAATISIVEFLLAHGADINAKVEGYSTSLQLAAASGQLSLVELLAKGSDINSKSREDVTPLYAAVKLNRANTAGWLIAHGAKVNALTESGYTSLTWAAHQGNKEIVELLLTHGADVNAKDNNGRTPLVWALVTDNFSTSTGRLILTPYLSQLNPAEQRQMQRELLRMKGEWREVAMLLINHGANNDGDSTTASPLYAAANLGYKEVVEALLDRGADINDTRAGETALHAAIAEKHRDVADLLVKRGADMNARNMSNRTPLHFLAHYIDDRKLAELMLEHGADVYVKDKNGQTPLDFAIKSGNKQVAEVLQRHTGR